ncbi:MAG TPA: hypothetical protein VLE44_01370 [Candidatus Saccharimonadales bacterium]|nr:hypothetical protein [Candidatus Saccharimonadales bacterium]
MSPDILRKDKDKLIAPFTEMDVLANSSWLAAGLTLKGTFSQGISRASHKGLEPNEFPYVRLVDRRHPKKIKMLSFIYGNDSNDPGVWEVSKAVAVRLINLSTPFLVPRKKLMTKSNEDGSVEFYKKNIKITKRYPAGIVDFGASFYLLRDGKRIKGIKMSVQSTKKNLLVALQNEYLGSIRCVKEAGAPIEINGTKNSVKTDIWAWELRHNDVLNLLKDIEDYLLIADEKIYQILEEYQTCAK